VQGKSYGKDQIHLWWASMSKNEIAKNRAREQEAKRNRQYDDLSGSDTSSGTADLFDHKDFKYVMENKTSQVKEGAIPNPVGHTSFKNYYNSVISFFTTRCM
jgi:hypothetical protein